MKRLGILVWVLVLIACEVAAQPPENCIPEGLKPDIPPEKQVTRTRGNWLKPPGLKWSFQHASELLPTKPVARGTTVPAPLIPNPKKLDNLPFDDGMGNPPTTFKRFLETDTDAIIVLHKGKIIYERYDYEYCMKPETQHLLFSASKSFVGLVAAIMASRGDIDENARVSTYVPELAASGYGDATLRQVMDMRVDVKFIETYKENDCRSDINRYLAAAGWFDCPPNFQVWSNLYGALKALEREGQHGAKFDYKSPNTDVLAWVVSKISNKSLSELVSELIWSKIGAESDAYYLVDPLGKEAAFGGLNVTLRDDAANGGLERAAGGSKECY